MRSPWPEDTVFRRLLLDVEDQHCEHCGATLHVCDHRFHRIHTLQGPLELVCRLAHCSDRVCPARRHTLSPAAELSLTLPWWQLGWDVFCWLGRAASRGTGVCRNCRPNSRKSTSWLCRNTLSTTCTATRTCWPAQQDPGQLARPIAA